MQMALRFFFRNFCGPIFLDATVKTDVSLGTGYSLSPSLRAPLCREGCIDWVDWTKGPNERAAPRLIQSLKLHKKLKLIVFNNFF